MKLPRARVLESALRNAVIRAEILINRWLGREFIPLDLGAFNIETSSACNLKCRFCAYEKKSSPKVNLANDSFQQTVEQATKLGFTSFHLTPTTGDVFMDKHAFEKFAFLDAHPKVDEYHFFTNLTIPTREQLLRLREVKKLKRLTISVYGHDEASFTAITKADAKIYRRLLANLETVLEHREEWPFSISIGFRSTFGVPREDASDLMRLLTRFRRAEVPIHASHGVYNNWAGYITEEDVAGLDVHIRSGAGIHKSGACVKLFDGVQVMATGAVNACSCRDVDATLRIGDIHEKPLAEILSPENASYQRIIQEQQEGHFRPVCESCDWYRSIYHQPKNYRRERKPVQTVAQVFEAMRERTAGKTPVDEWAPGTRKTIRVHEHRSERPHTLA